MLHPSWCASPLFCLFSLLHPFSSYYAVLYPMAYPMKITGQPGCDKVTYIWLHPHTYACHPLFGQGHRSLTSSSGCVVMAPGAWLYRCLGRSGVPWAPLLGHVGVLWLHLPSGQDQSTQGTLWCCGHVGGRAGLGGRTPALTSLLGSRKSTLQGVVYSANQCKASSPSWWSSVPSWSPGPWLSSPLRPSGGRTVSPTLETWPLGCPLPAKGICHPLIYGLLEQDSAQEPLQGCALGIGITGNHLYSGRGHLASAFPIGSQVTWKLVSKGCPLP